MDAPFGIDGAALGPVLEAATGLPGAQFTGITRCEDAGTDNTRLCDVRHRTPGGGVGEVRLFVKRCIWGGVAESVHLRHLAAHGVPVPRLYGALRDESGVEVIFTEALTATGFRRDDETEWRRLLSAVARLNACPMTADYAPHLYRYEQIGQAGGGWWISGLDASPGPEDIAEGLSRPGVGEGELGALRDAAVALFARVAAQARGLVHQDLRPDNVGWRGERAELVVFDVHKNALGPRFTDAAPFLAAPDWSSDAAFLDGPADEGAGSRRDALIGHYLDEYARAGGPAVPPETFRAEASDLVWAHRVSILPWLAETGRADRVAEVLDYLRANARRNSRTVA